jgi:hypothetical protein
MNERSRGHEAYGDKLTPKLFALFPGDDLEINHRAEGGDLHFSIAWGNGKGHRNMQLWITRNALDDYLMRERTSDAAEIRLLDFVKTKIREMAPTASPQKVVVVSEDVTVYG